MTSSTPPTRSGSGNRVIFLATSSRMQRELLGRALRRMERSILAIEVEDVDTLLALCNRLRPDWVVLSLGQDGTLPQVADDLASANVDLCVLALSENGGIVKMHTPAGTGANGEQWQVYSQLRLAELLAVMEHSMEDVMEDVEERQTV